MGHLHPGALRRPIVLAAVALVSCSSLATQYQGLGEGPEHTCAIVVGGVRCWGANFSGQLGDGTNVDRNVPVAVVGTSGVVTTIASGSEHTCAVVDGVVKCWGANGSGQLGDGTSTNRNVAIEVYGLRTRVTDIATGGEHTCALTTMGAVWCWGANFSGQLGDGTHLNRHLPVKVSDLSDVVIAIAAGSEHTCAITALGRVKCWGADFSGQLGNASQTNRNVPTDVDALPGTAIAIAAGSEHTCAATTKAVWCWGANWSGQLGDATNTNRSVPVPVLALRSDVVSIAAGSGHTCAVSSRGVAACWGANFSGQLGDGSNVNRNVPARVVALTGSVVEVSAGSEHSCVVNADGTMRCWGANFSGQLGNGGNENRNEPFEVFGLRAVRPTVHVRIL